MAEDHSNRRVMIVDDDKMIIKLVTIVFEGLGFKHINANQSSLTALTQIAASPEDYDIIVLDLLMPELDGIRFLSELSNIEYKGNVILMSGTDREVLTALERIGSKKLNILGALEKPITPAKVKSLLEKLNYIQPKVVTVHHPHQVTSEKIEKALAADEFIPFFQPKVDLKSNLVTGFEALARWQQKDGELVSPAEFIPLAERTRQILEIDLMILDKTCANMKRWKSMGLSLKASVNASANSLSDKNAAERIIDTVKNHQIALSELILELTESVIIDEHSVAMENILRLHLYGAKLSMDDFGTGYSGMQYLHQIPFTELKIDGSFVKGALTESSKSAIIESSVELGEKLGLTTVCEGIESYEDLAVVKGIGAQLGQGYYFAAPMPADKFIEWIKHYSN